MLLITFVLSPVVRFYCVEENVIRGRTELKYTLEPITVRKFLFETTCINRKNLEFSMVAVEMFQKILFALFLRACFSCWLKCPSL